MPPRYDGAESSAVANIITNSFDCPMPLSSRVTNAGKPTVASNPSSERPARAAPRLRAAIVNVADVLERVDPADDAVRDLGGDLQRARAVGGDVDLERSLRELHVQVEFLTEPTSAS